MPFRLALALSVSVLFIGVASWYRFGTVEKVQPNIVAVDTLETGSNNYEDILGDFTAPKTAGTTTPQDPLSSTDLIGRQLILDYVGLAANGQATEAGLDLLASQYVENIATISKTVAMSSADIKTVADTKANFQNYDKKITKIYGDYAESIGKMRAVADNPDTLDSALYAAMLNLNATYNKAALELKDLPVPLSLATPHLKLLNSYLSSAAATKAISETQQDPAAAFASLVILSENNNAENAILNEISQILISNDI